jgi:hypothetical protein
LKIFIFLRLPLALSPLVVDNEFIRGQRSGVGYVILLLPPLLLAGVRLSDGVNKSLSSSTSIPIDLRFKTAPISPLLKFNWAFYQAGFW